MIFKQSCRIWTDDYIQSIAETSLHPHEVIVSCDFLTEGIIGSWFFKNEDNCSVKVNGDIDLFVVELDVDVREIWFQQDGNSLHTANETINLL